MRYLNIRKLCNVSSGFVFGNIIIIIIIIIINIYSSSSTYFSLHVTSTVAVATGVEVA